jgi:hypothetical protein
MRKKNRSLNSRGVGHKDKGMVRMQMGWNWASTSDWPREPINTISRFWVTLTHFNVYPNDPMGEPTHHCRMNRQALRLLGMTSLQAQQVNAENEAMVSLLSWACNHAPLLHGTEPALAQFAGDGWLRLSGSWVVANNWNQIAVRLPSPPMPSAPRSAWISCCRLTSPLPYRP